MTGSTQSAESKGARTPPPRALQVQRTIRDVAVAVALCPAALDARRTRPSGSSCGLYSSSSGEEASESRLERARLHKGLGGAGEGGRAGGTARLGSGGAEKRRTAQLAQAPLRQSWVRETRSGRYLLLHKFYCSCRHRGGGIEPSYRPSSVAEGLKGEEQRGEMGISTSPPMNTRAAP